MSLTNSAAALSGAHLSMEPSTKKRKLAPKVNASPAPITQPLANQYAHEPSLPQNQHHANHDAPLTERQDFESFARHLQDAAMLIQRQTERLPYVDVSVLLLSWEEDPSVDEDITAFENILHNKYNYVTHRWQIPSVPNPSIKLGVQMASFLENARPNHLLVIYYAGHGYLGGEGHLYWACNARDDAAKLKWDGVRCLFEDAQSDILLLLDSCGIPDPPTAGSHGIKQGIAAFTPEHRHNSREKGSRSFTTEMIDALQNLHNGRPFSVNKFYEEIIAQKQLHNAHVGRPVSTMQSRLPLFFSLTPGKSQYLSLAPLPPRPATDSQNETAFADVQTQPGREDDLIDPESVADLRFDETRILVCTTFVGDASPDMSFFNQWLQNRPPLGSRIAVEGMFLGPPTMLLVSMPQSIWNVVQHDKVCCFLGYISSHNMIHLYEKLVGPAGVRPSVKQVEDGRILSDAGGELATDTPARNSRDTENLNHSSASRDNNVQSDGAVPLPQSSPSRPPPGVEALKSKDDVEDSAEMQEAAEQLKALSHVRHRSDEAAPAERMRTLLPEAISDVAREKARLSQTTGDYLGNDPAMLVDMTTTATTTTTPYSKARGPRRSVMKQETHCSHCSHAPFKDFSSLRKHIAAAHTRPFPCAFSFAGCTSTFGSKNEWKRHIASQHLCLQYYRCSACPYSAIHGKGSEFNRKDLFTQHLRRMHAPFQIKRAISQGDGRIQLEWEAYVKEMQQSCLVTRRQPPQRAACSKPECQKSFEGPNAWDEWTEHVGRHMERGEGPMLGADGLLIQWALDEGIIESKGGEEYRLCAANGLLSSHSSSGPLLDGKDSLLTSFTDASQAEDNSMTDTRLPESEADDSQAIIT